MNTLFVLSYNFYVRARVTPCSFSCRELLGYILYGNPFACICNVGFSLSCALTFNGNNDIIISRFNDIIMEVLYLVKENKANRTRQVQFRMDPEIFNKLKATIVYDKDMHSMADLFNEAAEKYLKEKEAGGKGQ